MSKPLFIAAATLASALALAETPPPAKEATCKACHGPQGNAPIVASYPKLGGQNKEYLISALKAYRAGQRKGGLAAAMTAQASQLSDAEIDQLAEYYSLQKQK
ncbi:c-type cytochrome [bacterium SCSIO 12696]|nr:c-type cytochrome [bacterium SCSIO 12696]